MMSIFIARHLISIIAQIAKKAMKVPQKNCIKSPAKEGGDSGWSEKNFALGALVTFWLGTHHLWKQNKNSDESKKYFLFCQETEVMHF